MLTKSFIRSSLTQIDTNRRDIKKNRLVDVTILDRSDWRMNDSFQGDQLQWKGLQLCSGRSESLKINNSGLKMHIILMDDDGP